MPRDHAFQMITSAPLEEAMIAARTVSTSMVATTAPATLDMLRMGRLVMVR